MKLFEKIINDIEIIERYEQIAELEAKDGWAYHDMEHIRNVANLTEQLLRGQGYDEKFIEEAKVAAVLHDVGSLEGKKEHAFRSWQYAIDYFERNNLKLENEELVLEAIKVHSNGFDSESAMALALIFADKIDIKRTRVAPFGLKVKGMRQLQFIEDISINIDNQELGVNFICHEKLDLKELEEFPFFLKVLKSINSFSKKVKLTPKILLNNKEWSLLETKCSESVKLT